MLERSEWMFRPIPKHLMIPAAGSPRVVPFGGVRSGSASRQGRTTCALCARYGIDRLAPTLWHTLPQPIHSKDGTCCCASPGRGAHALRIFGRRPCCRGRFPACVQAGVQGVHAPCGERAHSVERGQAGEVGEARSKAGRQDEGRQGGLPDPHQVHQVCGEFCAEGRQMRCVGARDG